MPKENHIYIFNGAPKTGKTSLLGYLQSDDQIGYDRFYVDDFIIMANPINYIVKKIMDYQWINSTWKDFEKAYDLICICVNTDENHVIKLVESLQNDPRFENWLITVCQFKQGGEYHI